MCVYFVFGIWWYIISIYKFIVKGVNEDLEEFWSSIQVSYVNQEILKNEMKIFIVYDIGMKWGKLYRDGLLYGFCFYFKDFDILLGFYDQDMNLECYM